MLKVNNSVKPKYGELLVLEDIFALVLKTSEVPAIGVHAGQD